LALLVSGVGLGLEALALTLLALLTSLILTTRQTHHLLRLTLNSLHQDSDVSQFLEEEMIKFSE